MSETTIGPGRKDDNGKTRVDLLPVGALQEVAKVLTFGANKYGANNWQNVAPKARYYGAALRHLWARARGERIDPESGLPHLAHAACCVLFLLSGEVGHDEPDAFEPDEPVFTNCSFTSGRRLRPCRQGTPRPSRPGAWTPKVGDVVRATFGNETDEGPISKIDDQCEDCPYRLRGLYYTRDEIELVQASGATSGAV